MIDLAKLAVMTEWASRFGCTVQPKGEVGFGRPAVGILHGSAYVDYDYELFYVSNGGFWKPDNAYHKHDCLAVLVTAEDWDKIPDTAWDDALEKLWEWVTWLIENNYGVAIQSRETYNKSGFGRDLELMMGGITQAKVVKL